jgi:hypothetical protein
MAAAPTSEDENWKSRMLIVSKGSGRLNAPQIPVLVSESPTSAGPPSERERHRAVGQYRRTLSRASHIDYRTTDLQVLKVIIHSINYYTFFGDIDSNSLCAPRCRQSHVPQFPQPKDSAACPPRYQGRLPDLPCSRTHARTHTHTLSLSLSLSLTRVESWRKYLEWRQDPGLKSP